MELRDKVVVVTGGAQGLGLAMAKGLAEKGAKLALLDVNEESLAAAAESLASTGVEVMTHRTNVAAEEEVTGAFEAIVSRFGQLNGL
ncbi:MAG: SDR family NAD(P)-dependent oxidoreductase, partial [Halieaceae bacterium]